MKNTAISLAKIALNNPSLFEVLNEDTYENFVLCVARHDIKLAKKLDSRRPIVGAQNRVLFWEAVGILVSEY